MSSQQPYATVANAIPAIQADVVANAQVAKREIFFLCASWYTLCNAMTLKHGALQ